MFRLIREWLDRHFSDPQILILSLLLVVGFVAIFFLGRMLIPVFASVVIAYLLDGMVTHLQVLRIPRPILVIVVFVMFLAVLLLLIVWLLPLLSSQVGQLLQQLPSMVKAGQSEMLRLPERYPGFISEQQIKQVLDVAGTEFTHLVRRLLSLSMASLKGFISLLVYLILVPLMVFFLLKDKFKILGWLSNLLPDDRGLSVEVWREVNLQIGNYIRGKIWEILIIWTASFITFKMLGLQFSMLISLFTGLSVLIPYIGVTVMFFPVALIAYFQWGPGSQFLYTLLAYTVIQLLDGNLLAPLLLSEVVDLHPVAIIVAVLIFGGLWGIWGLFFAIPLATLVQAVLKAVTKRHLAAQSLEEPSESN
ncbi:MAG: permease [Deltaproteobacteria bacterium SG8_13]|nr:MAG: permease [Deltaproteobacteria bacterium SG8_13]